MPLFSARSRQEFLNQIPNDAIKEQKVFERSLTGGVGKIFSIDGFCIPCGENVSFQVDMLAGGRQEKNGFFPNCVSGSYVLVAGCRIGSV